MVLITKGSDFHLSAHWEGGARTKFLNAVAKKSAVWSEGMAEEGGEFRHARAKSNSGQPRRSARRSRTPQKNTLFIRRRRNPARVIEYNHLLGKMKRAKSIFLWWRERSEQRRGWLP